MKQATREDLMKLTSRKIKMIEIADWDMSIILKSLSAKTVLACQEYMKQGDNASMAYALIANSVVDSVGKYMFTMDEVADMDYSIVDRLTLEVMDLNGLAPEQVEKAREEIKNQKDSSTIN